MSACVRSILFVTAVFAVIGGNLQIAAADVIRMGGTGAATELLKRIGATFAADNEAQVEVIPSLGSSGALRAATAGVLDVVASGRPLTPEESANGLRQVFAVRTPFGFVTSHRNPGGLKAADVARLYGTANASWDDGTPVRVILRPRSESDTALLGNLFGLAAAIESARLRPDVPMAATDQDNADLAENVQGSLTAASLVQVKLEQRRLQFISLDGVELSLENLENGKYPYAKTMYFVLPAKKNPAAEQFIAFLRSPAGLNALRQTGNLPSEN
jgi:phosphate transport system substrate-binding protein